MAAESNPGPSSDRPSNPGPSSDGPPSDRPVTVEFLVEPFNEGEPGDHVQSGIEALQAHGLDVELGPFASVAAGDPDVVATAVGDLIKAALGRGATSLRIHVGVDADTLAIGGLHDALANMIRLAERNIGAKVDAWSRADKQRVVRLLDEQGAFLLRGAVDDIARIMGVSRITIYNYLNAIDRS